MSDLREDSLMIISASAFNLLWYIALTEVYEENLASHRYITRKEGNSLIAFSDNYSCSLIVQNLTHAMFVNVSCNVESGIVSINFHPLL